MAVSSFSEHIGEYTVLTGGNEPGLVGSVAEVESVLGKQSRNVRSHCPACNHWMRVRGSSVFTVLSVIDVRALERLEAQSHSAQSPTNLDHVDTFRPPSLSSVMILKRLPRASRVCRLENGHHFAASANFSYVSARSLITLLRTAYNCQREVVSTEDWTLRLTSLLLGTRSSIFSKPVKSTMHLLANRFHPNWRRVTKGDVHIATSGDSLAECNDDTLAILKKKTSLSSLSTFHSSCSFRSFWLCYEYIREGSS